MPRIDELWAYVCEDEGPEDEGIQAVKVGPVWFPMVGADKHRIELFRSTAQGIATQSGKPIKLVRFRLSELVEVIQP